MKDSFILHLDQYAPIQGLSLEQKGMLLDAVFRFHMGEDPAFPDPVVGMAFAFFRAAFERNAEKYQAVIERNRENGKRGGRPRKAVGCDVDNENPKNPVGFSEPKKADSDADSDLLALGNSKVSAQSKTDRRNVSSASASPSAPPDAGIEPEKTQEFYRTKKGRKLTGKRLETFERFWSAFGFAKGKAEAADSWFDIPKLTDGLVAQIVAAAEREAAARPGLVAKSQTPKWAQGWLSARRWEDEDTGHSGPTLDEMLEQQGIAT